MEGWSRFERSLGVTSGHEIPARPGIPTVRARRPATGRDELDGPAMGPEADVELQLLRLPN
jgi:hypothetical protein